MAAPPASAIPGRCPSRSPTRSTRAISWSRAVLSGNRNFEGRIHPQVTRQLPGLAAAGRRLCAGRLDAHRPREGPARRRQRRQAGLSARHLAVQPGGRRHRRSSGDARDVPAAATATCSRARRNGSAVSGASGMTYDWRRRLDLSRACRPISRTCRRSRRRSATCNGARVLAILGDSITTDHISPAGSIKKDSPAGDYLIELSGAPGRLQLLRLAPRQPRGDDARHLRQYPHQERDGAGRRRRHDQAAAGRHGDADLRRGDGVQEARHAAGHHRRQGIRHRLVARLGGQGHPAARASRR